MRVGGIQCTVILIVLSAACMTGFWLQADFIGDVARSAAATRAALLAADNVVKLNREIELKRAPLSQVETLFESLRQRHAQLKSKITSTGQRLLNMQQMLTQTNEKINALIKKASQKNQEALPLFTFLQQAAMIKDFQEAQATIGKLQTTINDVSTLFKTEQANLEKLHATLIALQEGIKP